MPDDEAKAIAAFPWVTCNEVLEVGSVRLLPYVRGQAPGDSANAKQTDIDAIFQAYANYPNQLVTEASLLEVDDYRTGMDAGAHVSRLFQARQLIAFAALAKRRLFSQHFDYCNFHTYTLVVQRYVSGKAERFAFDSRRRDGSVSHIWATDKFAHQRPNHVSSNARIDIEVPLLAALLRIEEDSSLLEAVREFNSANTDSDDVPPHVEVVMVKSAFEWLLGINTDVQEFVDALHELLLPVLAAPPTDGPVVSRWRERWPKAQRLIEAWARDFCDVRGAAAHGERRPAARFVWHAEAHLAFASIFFPLLLKLNLAAEGRFEMGSTDYENLQHIEKLLAVDPFSAQSLKLADENAHPWADAYYELLFNNFVRRGASSEQ